jgi:iron(III) transport system ATP-binding protein
MSEIRTQAVGVTIENLSLSFGDTEVLKGVSLTIEPGEFFTFLGPSGSGKSTLLRAIAGFGPEPSGRILIGGDDVTHLPPWTRNVGMVFQSYALWPHMTVYKNVAFGLEERKVAAKEIRQRVDAALDLVDLGEYAERRPSQLSGGQQQRVALARTIVIEPRVLLLDEPLSNLDANLRIQMRRDILALQRKLKLTTIFVTHDQEEANTTSDRIAVLDQGVIQQVGAPIDLYDEPVNRFVADFLGTANLLDGRIEKDVFQADGGIRFPLPGNDLKEGSATVMVRPQDLVIRDRQAEEKGGATISGEVLRREFLGNLIRYGVQSGGHVLLVDDTHHAGRPVFADGDKVSLILDVAQVRILGG